MDAPLIPPDPPAEIPEPASPAHPAETPSESSPGVNTAPAPSGVVPAHEPTPPPTVSTIAAALQPKKKKKKKKKAKKNKEKNGGLGSARGIETMFRTSYRVQMDLTALADAKANIMITINGLILSIILASIASKIDTNPFLLIPTSVTLITCLFSIIFAVLAAVPRVDSRPLTLEDVRRNDTNLLFFGNFTNLSRSDYHIGMIELMRDPERIYRNMINDIYGIGSVLRKKFTLLRTSYIIFMVGIIISVLLFILTFFINAGENVPVQGSGEIIPGIF